MKTLIETINNSWLFNVKAFNESKYISPDGHTLHYIIEGSYFLELNKIKFHVSQGDIIYYSDHELHRWLHNEDTVSFYSINFHAPFISPLPISQRVLKNLSHLKPEFENCHNSLMIHSFKNNLIASISLEKICLEVFETNYYEDPSSISLWNKIEIYIKKNKLYRISIPELAEIFNKSPITLHRTCITEKGTSPGKFIRLLRLEEARKLIMYTSLNITEIAAALGYLNIHDFSRDFTKYYHFSPNKAKNKL